MKKLLLAVSLLLASAVYGQSPALPSVPGASSAVPIAIGGHVTYDAAPPAGGKHTTGGLFLLFPATVVNSSTKYPTYARLSIDTTPGQGCKACIATSYRFGAEQVVATTGNFLTDLGFDYGATSGPVNTTGSLSFDLREVYNPPAKKYFVYVSVGAQQNGNLGLVSKYEVGAAIKLGK